MGLPWGADSVDPGQESSSPGKLRLELLKDARPCFQPGLGLLSWLVSGLGVSSSNGRLDWFGLWGTDTGRPGGYFNIARGSRARPRRLLDIGRANDDDAPNIRIATNPYRYRQ